RKFLETGDRLPPSTGGQSEGTHDQGAAPAQGLQIDPLVIRFAVLPAAKYDANPFVRHAPDRRMVRLVLVLAEMLVISFGPLRLPDRMKSKLVKGLPQKRRTSPPEVDPTGLAAGLLHRRNATVALHFEGADVALAARPHGLLLNAAPVPHLRRAARRTAHHRGAPARVA